MHSVLQLLATVIWFSAFKDATACNATLFQVGNTIYTLSDALVDANTASNECKLLGGQLAIVKDQIVKDKFYQEILLKYNQSDLQRVYISYDHLIFERIPPQWDWEIVYKFSKDSAITGGWRSAEELGQLWYFDMYKTNDMERKAVYFCQNKHQKWRVVTPGESSDKGPITNGCPTNESWHNDFHLYTRNSSATGYQPIYNFWRNFTPHGSRLTDVDSFYDGFKVSKATLYLPEVKSVFVGANYNSTTKQWLWSDGTNANFATKPSKCKQKAFSYGIKDLEDRNCYGRLAYYSCEVKLKTFITIEKCNSTIIQISWSNNIYTLAQKTGYNYRLKIAVWKNGHNILAKSFSGTVSNFTVVGLEERTGYEIQANATITGCGSFNVVSSSKLTTGYGKPDPVTDAYVKSPQPCVVAFNKSSTDNNVISYEITAKSAKHESVYKYFANVNSFTIDITDHPSEENISLTIQAFSCEGRSQPMKVNGFCYTPAVATTAATNLNSIDLGLTFGIISTSILVIIVGVLVALKIWSGTREQNSNLTVPENNQQMPETPGSTFQKQNQGVHIYEQVTAKRQATYENAGPSDQHLPCVYDI